MKYVPLFERIIPAPNECEDEAIRVTAHVSDGVLIVDGEDRVYVSRSQINALIGALRQFKKEVAE